ncbi:MAG: hypothetical protein ACMG6E_01940 [Candidatus Roizmanbacteria bacterium]
MDEIGFCMFCGFQTNLKDIISQSCSMCGFFIGPWDEKGRHQDGRTMQPIYFSDNGKRLDTPIKEILIEVLNKSCIGINPNYLIPVLRKVQFCAERAKQEASYFADFLELATLRFRQSVNLMHASNDSKEYQLATFNIRVGLDIVCLVVKHL